MGWTNPKHIFLFTTNTKLSGVILFSAEFAGTHSGYFLFALVDVNSKMESKHIILAHFPWKLYKND